MSKALKLFLVLILGIPVTLVLAVVGVFLFKDANDFKPTIEQQAKEAVGIYLSIEGELSWSLIPIGIDVNKLSILDQDQQHFASADQIHASVDFWSIFSGEPKIQSVLLDGLDLHLIQHSETKNNWSNILPEKAALPEDNTSPPEALAKEESPEPVNEQPASQLNFLVESFQLSNTRIRFQSLADELDVNIAPLNLVLSNITLDEHFPISLSYSLSEKKNQIELDSSLTATLRASKDLKQFSLSQLETTYKINAATVSPETLQLELLAEVEVDTTAESVSISSLMLSLNDLALLADAEIKNYSSEPDIDADIHIPGFSLKALLSSLNITLPDMQNKQAMEKLSLASKLSLKNDVFSLNDLSVGLDESQWTGSISHNLESSASKVRLRGDKLTVDDYLPPAADETQADTAPEQAPPADSSQTAQALLPIDTLNALNLDIELIQDSLTAKNIETNDLVITLMAKQGQLTQSLNGKLYDGVYASEISINTQNKEQLWGSEQSIKDVDLAPLFNTLNIEALEEYGNIAGLLNLSANSNMRGNTIESLKSSATSQINFDVDQGAFEGLSLNALTCKGFALINRESVDTSTWPKATPFNTLEGSAELAEQQLNTKFDIITSGIHADSQGSINIEDNTLKVLANLKVIGELGDNACRVNEKVTKIGIPVICQGAFDTPPAELCTLDTSRLGDMAKELAMEEAKRKANKEIDRALDKHLGDKKEPIKSLLNKFLK